MLAFAVTVPLAAVTVAVPGATPVTRPVVLTVATAVLDDVQVSCGDAIAAPPASVAVALSCRVRPTITVPLAGCTLIAATACCTVMVAVPLTDPPETVARMTAVPFAAAVTTPVDALTVATDGDSLVQENDLPLTVAPAEFLATADKAVVAPSALSDADAGVTTTVVTAFGSGPVPSPPPPPHDIDTTVAEPQANARMTERMTPPRR